MSLKKTKRKKIVNLESIQFSVPKNFKVNPVNVIEKTKNKIGNLYNNFKKERDKEKKKIGKKKKVR